ncbi:MAG: FkbM family methyltransferase [Isosphaeraceae bacterium]|nr:FkbM family methyltransferase [Isosphaeraceae bacterium]
MSHPSLLARALVAYGAHLPDHPRKWWLHRKLRDALRVEVAGDHEVVRDGIRWRLTPSDYCHASLYWLGIKDKWEHLNLERLVPRDAVVLDLGANFGYYSVKIARRLSDKGKVYALEPNPTNHTRLVENVALNGLENRISVHRLGVSDASGTLTMVDDPTNTGHALVSTAEGAFPIEVVTIDDFVESQGLDRLDVIILDVEGYEPRALRGARRTIERFRPMVFVEFWPHVMSLQGTSVGAIADELEAYGYVMFKPDRDRLQPLGDLPQGDPGINVFSFHRDSIPPSVGS